MIAPGKMQLEWLMFLTGFIVVTHDGIAQDTIVSRNERYIFWQPNAVIDISDYQQEPDSGDIRMSAKYGVGVLGTIELLRVVDVPKRKRDLAKMGEAVYTVPAFCRACSAMLWEDSMGIEHDKIFLDMAEISVRCVREKLDSIRAQLHSDNTGVMFLETFVQDAEVMRLAMMRDYLQQVVLTKSDSAYSAWRAFVEYSLTRAAAYATRPEDYQRFIAAKPIKAGYVVPEFIMGDMFANQRRR